MSDLCLSQHVSMGQECAGFPSPIPPVGGPTNFNFLPVFANLSLGVMPHTVQLYTLDDPTGDTYGNANFSDILEIGLFAASQGRETVFFGENTYWCNYDINVPLNLGPAYAWRAVADLRTIAARQDPQKPFAGNFLFERFAFRFASFSCAYTLSMQRVGVWIPVVGNCQLRGELGSALVLSGHQVGSDRRDGLHGRPLWRRLGRRLCHCRGVLRAFFLCCWFSFLTPTRQEVMREPLVFGVGAPTDKLNGIALG